MAKPVRCDGWRIVSSLAPSDLAPVVGKVWQSNKYRAKAQILDQGDGNYQIQNKGFGHRMILGVKMVGTDEGTVLRAGVNICNYGGCIG